MEQCNKERRKASFKDRYCQRLQSGKCYKFRTLIMDLFPEHEFSRKPLCFYSVFMSLNCYKGYIATCSNYYVTVDIPLLENHNLPRLARCCPSTILGATTLSQDWQLQRLGQGDTSGNRADGIISFQGGEEESSNSENYYFRLSVMIIDVGTT